MNLRIGERVLIGGSFIRKGPAEGCHVMMEHCLYHRLLCPNRFSQARSQEIITYRCAAGETVKSSIL